MFADYPESPQARNFVFQMFGHEIEDKDVLDCWKEKRLHRKKPSLYHRIRQFFYLIYHTITGPKHLMEDKVEYIERRKYDLVALLRKYKTSKDILQGMFESFHEVSNMQLKNHGPVSMGSSIKNALLKGVISSGQSRPQFRYNCDIDVKLMTELISFY